MLSRLRWDWQRDIGTLKEQGMQKEPVAVFFFQTSKRSQRSKYGMMGYCLHSLSKSKSFSHMIPLLMDRFVSCRLNRHLCPRIFCAELDCERRPGLRMLGARSTKQKHD
mmetsp:Transcript_34222/g.77061  ORF Transcript_34222/g.77061 Transcript_34222/m.77061 type:complete len:109 (+) Transcript_34222:801-1127(+)